jgi:hypothetical protein
VIVGIVVHVPIGVDSVGGQVSSIAGALVVLFRLECVIEMLATVECIMVVLVADLASGLATTTSMAIPVVALTAMTKTPMTRTTVVSRTTAIVSRLVDNCVGRGLDLVGRIVALVAHFHA